MKKYKHKLVFEKKIINEINSADMAQIYGAGFTDGCSDGCSPLNTYWNCSLTNCTDDCPIGIPIQTHACSESCYETHKCVL